jgi:hypothetical protein
MSTFEEKLIDFDISIEHELRSTFEKSELELAIGKLNEKKDTKSKSIQGLKGLLAGPLTAAISEFMHEQRNVRSNEHRNVSVVKRTESRIIWFAVLECIAIVGLAVGQVFVIQTFFSKSARTRV